VLVYGVDGDRGRGVGWVDGDGGKGGWGEGACLASETTLIAKPVTPGPVMVIEFSK
jgi:hypothetical protein